MKCSAESGVIQSYSKFVGMRIDQHTVPRLPTTNNILTVCNKTIDIFKKEGTVIHIYGSYVIVGDLHGSLQDLLNIFSKFSQPPSVNYIFLGDYVDRGKYSIEVVLYILALKCMYPKNVYVIRGNHEFKNVNRTYGFYEQCHSAFKADVLWESFNRVFSYIPLAAVLNDRVFCVHGGLSPMIANVKDIEDIRLPIESFDEIDAVADLVWGDPSDKTETYIANERGAGYLFGKTAVHDFLRDSGLNLLVRAHQCIPVGVSTFAESLGLTVFSCSDYQNTKNNCGIVTLDDHKVVTLYSIKDKDVTYQVQMYLEDDCIGLKQMENASK